MLAGDIGHFDFSAAAEASLRQFLLLCVPHLDCRLADLNLLTVACMVMFLQGTGDWAVYQIFAAAQAITMTQGIACVRLCAVAGAFNSDSMLFTAAGATVPVQPPPVAGKPVPGKIEAEDFDAGGQGMVCFLMPMCLLIRHSAS